MKKIFITIMVIATIVAMASCKKIINPVQDVEPVDTTFWSGNSIATRFPIEQFISLGESNDTACQRTMVDVYRAQLTANVVTHYPKIQDEESIKFILCSGYAKDVQSGDGKTYSGDFKNELVIIIDDPSVKDTIFLTGGNTLSKLTLSDQHDLGIAKRWKFVLQEGYDLRSYLLELKDWHGIRAHYDPEVPYTDGKGNVVSQEGFIIYLLENEFWLYEGDVIDIFSGVAYNRSHYEIDFAKRQAKSQTNSGTIIAKAEMKRNRKG